MQIIIFVIIAIVVFFTKGIWGKYLVLLFSKKRDNQFVRTGEMVGSVFSPQGTKRTFIVAIEIDEMGDGKANFAIVKLKEKDII